MKEMKILFNWMKGQRGKMIGAMIATIIGIYFSTLIPIINQIAIDYVIQSGQALETNGLARFILGATTIRTQLLLCAGLIIAFTGGNALFNFFRGKWVAQSSEALAKTMKDKMYHHIQQLSFMYHKRVETGDLIQRCTSDIETIRVFLSTQLVELGNSIFMFVLIFYFMLQLNVRYALVSISLIPVLFLFSILFFRKIRDAFKEVDESEAKMSTMLQENLSGVRVVRAYCNQLYEIEKFENCNKEFRSQSYKLSKLSSMFWGSSDFLCFLQTLLIIIYGAYLVIQGEISLGTLQAFIAYGGMIIWPIRQLGTVLTEFGKATIAIKRIEEILNESIEFEEGIVLPKVQGNIEFNHVGFEYEDETGTKILDDISFTVEKGQTVAIIGRTGSGKTTLMNLLLRLYDYTEGSIKIDGIELNKLDKRFIRRQISVVLQEIFLYTKTVGENIKIAKKEASEIEIQNVAEVAAVHHVIESFKSGYETMVGERGVTLSGGQKQRVGIARALMRKSPILIFDDSLSAVDTKTDNEIREALTKQSKEVTTLIVTHRVSSVKDADQIIVLDQGRVIQKGNHQELITQEGLYKEFWNIQEQKEADAMNLMKTEGGN